MTSSRSVRESKAQRTAGAHSLGALCNLGTTYSPAHVLQFVGRGVCYLLKFLAPLWLPKIECGAEVQFGVSKACSNARKSFKKRPNG